MDTLFTILGGGAASIVILWAVGAWQLRARERVDAVREAKEMEDFETKLYIDRVSETPDERASRERLEEMFPPSKEEVEMYKRLATKWGSEK